ncbi:MAG TPA: cysteine--tRNA ligase [archaeon]|nr:cysteine--tRNA ligase [archaeon]
MLKLYNSLSRKKEIFKPVKAKNAGMYCCGPTAYWFQHIGNLRTYIFSDILRRTLEFNGFKVKQVMNVTDVGHLTSDADEGEDKIESAAAKEGRSAKEIVDYYFGIFQQDLKKLNIEEPTIWCKATEHIKEQIELIKKLEKKGFAYKTSDGIYFDTSKFRDYAKFARLKKSGLQAGKRVSLKEKRNITDFALWKFSEHPGKRQQEWDSPFGLGFPGWHIECSAMSMKYLGEHFDIHTGGIDHLQVHHTNEIAQSTAATGKKFVNYWVHGAFLVFKGEKISKSKGGLFTISELEEKGFLPLSYRYLVLTSHYRNPLEFSLQALEGAQNSLGRMKNIISEFKDDGKTNSAFLKKFESAINNDLDMPKALSVLWALLRDKKAVGKISAIKEMDKVFALDLLKKESLSVPSEIKKLADEREKARSEKNWQLADSLREQILQKGFFLDDTPEGTKIKKI